MKDEFDDDIIISYGDIVYSEDILSKLIEEKEDISVIIDKNWKEYWSKRIQNPLDDVETLKIDKTGYITEIGLKPKTYNDIQGQYIGLIKFSKQGIKVLKKEMLNYKNDVSLDFEKSYMTDILQYMVLKGHKLKSVPINGNWIEVDTIDDYNNRITIERLKNIVN